MENDRIVYVGSDGHLGRSRPRDAIKRRTSNLWANASKALFALKPVVFRYKQEINTSRKLSFGLIAEDVAEVSADLVSRDKEGKPQTVRYEAINAMLLNQFLKEHKKVAQELKATLAQQQEQIRGAGRTH